MPCDSVHWIMTKIYTYIPRFGGGSRHSVKFSVSLFPRARGNFKMKRAKCLGNLLIINNVAQKHFSHFGAMNGRN